MVPRAIQLPDFCDQPTSRHDDLEHRPGAAAPLAGLPHNHGVLHIEELKPDELPLVPRLDETLRKCRH